MVSFPYTASALKVVQPLGAFYVTVLPADLLLETCFSDQLRAFRSSGAGYELQGNQRGIKKERLREIAEYIDRYDSAFPNSVILAANLREEDGNIEEDDGARWAISESKGSGSCTLLIPSARKLAAIIDGQHRLFAFKYASSSRLDVQLVCSIYLDLPKPFQAQLFATINSTQKRVDKSLTYELFGYNVAEESVQYWSPDKLAVFLARRLNAESDSPLKDRIIVAPSNDFLAEVSPHEIPWKVSMATIVEGILRLISNNPKRDNNELLTPGPKERKALQGITPRDRSVLRNEYINGNDQLIYLTVRNYLTACDKEFWRRATDETYIQKTTGIQALFDVLRKLVPRAIETKDVSETFFVNQLAGASIIDFTNELYRKPSGTGRIEIRRAIENAIGLAEPS